MNYICKRDFSFQNSRNDSPRIRQNCFNSMFMKSRSKLHISKGVAQLTQHTTLSSVILSGPVISTVCALSISVQNFDLAMYSLFENSKNHTHWQISNNLGKLTTIYSTRRTSPSRADLNCIVYADLLIYFRNWTS